ncbi:MAG: class I SAM-dependent DNA methyltransferase [Candidatus Roizmanbacteria bacterium]|nr:class I SAM-dependent DNA methyltransferase [Candidatus Roizmanbacteria bacterium]
MAISNVIKSIQDIMRQDTGVDGDAQRISQLVWMLFLKLFDDKESEYELLDKNYVSPIPEKLRWRSWAKNDEGITGDDLVEFVNDKLFKGLKELAFSTHDDSRGYIVKEVFEDSYNYMKSGTLIRQVINKINEIDFNLAGDRHIFNDIYEKILKDLQSAGNAGEYYTPRAITQFIVEIIEPKLGDKILDPACGTGGFLTSSIELIRKKQVKTAHDNKKLQDSIFGIEKKPLPHLLCITNLMLHGIEVPDKIRRDNALIKPLREYQEKDRVNVIVTNPPFGGIEEDGVESNFPSQYRTKETADLFLLLIINLLKNGGQAGIVLPDGSLGGEGVKAKIRELWLKECNLHTIIRLPNSVFAPYATVATNLLFFTKGEPTKEVWYYDHQLPTGQKSYSKTKPIQLFEFDPIKLWWRDRKEGDFSWKVKIEDIKNNGWSLDIKNPKKKEEVVGHTSEELIKMLEDSLKKSENILKSIKSEL